MVDRGSRMCIDKPFWLTGLWWCAALGTLTKGSICSEGEWNSTEVEWNNAETEWEIAEATRRAKDE